MRALAAVAEGPWRLWGRTGSDYTERYPELAMLGRLPAGTVVDGELVVLQGGRADFSALLQRHQRHAGGPLGPSMQRLPIRYLVFDLLFHGGRSLLKEPLHERRARLRELLTEIHEPLLTFSDGIVGRGRDFFARVVAEGHEGVMAKHLASRYQPGKRTPAWKKIKPVQVLPCVIVGYRAGREGVHSLLVATECAGVLRYVGQVSRGLRRRHKSNWLDGWPNGAGHSRWCPAPSRPAGSSPRSIAGCASRTGRPTAGCAMPSSTAGSKARSSPRIEECPCARNLIGVFGICLSGLRPTR